jgi:uncharacterized protein YjaG (DUF416 family)
MNNIFNQTVEFFYVNFYSKIANYFWPQEELAPAPASNQQDDDMEKMADDFPPINHYKIMPYFPHEALIDPYHTEMNGFADEPKVHEEFC